MLAYGLFISLAAILEACSTPARVRALGARDGACGQALNKPEGRKTSECPDAMGVFGTMAIDGPGRPAVLRDARAGGMLNQR